jgi:hypothetical protein
LDAFLLFFMPGPHDLVVQSWRQKSVNLINWQALNAFLDRLIKEFARMRSFSMLRRPGKRLAADPGTAYLDAKTGTGARAR